jgi:hypothetical protein
MNTNRIKTDGFSNPETERYFREGWTQERSEKELQEEKVCALCRRAFPTPGTADPWVICLNPDSRYCYETLDPLFSCARHEPCTE